jgi:Tol biopolymer transport system component
MKSRRLIFTVILFVLIMSGLLAVTLATRPRLIEIYPLDGATNKPVTAAIRMVFSRPMDKDSVAAHVKLQPAVDGAFHWEGNTLVFIPAEAWEGDQEVSVNIENGARAASWLALPMQEMEWSFHTSGAWLAYLWPSDDIAEIYALNPETGVVFQYTSGMGVLEFSSSSDGLWLYFSAGNDQGGSDLYQLDRIDQNTPAGDLNQPRKLLGCGLAQCRNPTVSQDGAYLAYEYLLPSQSGVMGPAQIWTMSLPGEEISPTGPATHETVQPAWSSSGWLAYYDRTMRAYELIDLKTDEHIQLANQTGQPGAWSPDGSYYLAPEIYYYRASGSSETGTSHLMRYSLLGGEAVELSVNENVEDVEGVYSPGGESIAFTRKFLDAERWSFGRQVWMMLADGADPKQITDQADYNHYDLAWNSDGSILAYVRFNQVKLSDPPELWIVNADGSDPLQLVIGGYSPLWIP